LYSNRVLLRKRPIEDDGKQRQETFFRGTSKIDLPLDNLVPSDFAILKNIAQGYQAR